MWILTTKKVRERRLSRKLEGRETLHAAGCKKEAELYTEGLAEAAKRKVLNR